MDKEKQQTISYRNMEFDAVACVNPTYHSSIQITTEKGHTKWLGITEEEFKAIRELLTK